MFKRGYRWVYYKGSRFALNKKNKLFSELVLVSAAGYLLLKKTNDISITAWLRENYLNSGGVSDFVLVAGAIITYSLLVKCMAILFENYPAENNSGIEPEEISHCLLAFNGEIQRHIDKVKSNAPLTVNNIADDHYFDVNIRLVVDALAEHIRKCIRDMKIKRRDIFISLYKYSESKNSPRLEYVLHYDHKRDVVGSKVIPLGDDNYKDYECVKCMVSNETARYVLDKDKYAKSGTKRQKSLQQYMGCKLHSGDKVFGFMNIEFHNHLVFHSEEGMQDFMENNVFPFKLLLEYQYLKGDLFSTFSEFHSHWRVA